MLLCETGTAGHPFAANAGDDMNSVVNCLRKNAGWVFRLAIYAEPRGFDLPAWQIKNLLAFSHKIVGDLAFDIKVQFVSAMGRRVFVRVTQNDAAVNFLFKTECERPIFSKSCLQVRWP